MSRPVLACLAALALASLAVLPQRGEVPAGGGAKAFANSIGMKLVPIPAGKFQMGSPATEKERDANEQQHAVEIARPFYLGACEVAQAEYARLMGKPREGGKHNSWNPGPRFEGAPELPIENIRWNHAVEFCKRLTALAEEKRAGRKYRLPTEAEWEYACRAGTATPYHFGAALSSKQANFNGNFPSGGADKGPYLRKTARVGSYRPNAWGLYDMHGNVAEWCADFYDPNYYPKGPKLDPQGPAKGVLPTGYKDSQTPGEGQFYRVVRGGCWVDEARGCRSAYRFRAMPHDAYQLIGFRVACEVEGRK